MQTAQELFRSLLGIYLSGLLERINSMNRKSLLITLLLTLASLSWTQTESAPQAPPPKAGHDQMGMEHHGNMMEMHKKHMEAMKADLDKMKASLDQMKANADKISDPTEKARWQSNIDLWTMMIGHMEQMMKHMDAMGPGGPMGHGMTHHGGPAPAPPAAPKPQ